MRDRPSKESSGTPPSTDDGTASAGLPSSADGSAMGAADAEVTDHVAKLGSRSRGVETLFRASYRVHMDLTAIADNKANIMITVNGLILSILLASAASRTGDDRWMLLPITIALLGSVAAIVFAVLAAKPRLLKQPLTHPSEITERTNLLFFGNYTGLSEDDFVATLSELVGDTNRMYTTMMRDIYDMGTVLSHKFHFLQRSYSAFVVGMVASVGAFVVLFALNG